MSLLYRNRDGEWIELPEAEYADEAALSELLQHNPSIIPLSDLADAEPVPLMTVGRESPLGSGYADLLMLDANGRLTVVEVKLRSNPEMRREVVAQALSYAAYLEGETLEGFVERIWRPFASEYHGSAVAALPFTEGLSAATGVDLSPAALESGLSASLASGDFLVLIVVDEPHPQLRTTVSYVNRHATFDLHLVEVGFFRSGDHQALSPRVLDAGARSASGSSERRRWDMDGFLGFVGSNHSENVDAVGSLLEGLEPLVSRGLIAFAFGTGGAPSLKVQSVMVGKSILWVWPDGTINFPRYTMIGYGLDDGDVDQFMERIGESSGIPVSEYSGKQEPRLVKPGGLSPPVVEEVIAVVGDIAAMVAAHGGD